MDTESSSPKPVARVFLAGATGAVGRALVPRLVAEGHEVSAMTRSTGNFDWLREAGATPVLCDVFDAKALRRAVVEAGAQVVINQLTDLPKRDLKPGKLGDYYARNDRVRREGTENLLVAARAAGARRFIGQSVAFWYEPVGGMIKSEDDPLWAAAPDPIRQGVLAIEHSERLVLEAANIEGVVLRYGTFYGPNTWFSPDGDIGRQMMKRRYPVIGSGEGVTSFVHIGDAAAACAGFVGTGRPGVYNVVDDDPATANKWMPVFARAIGAKPPRRVPVWLARLMAGKALVEWTTTARGASNAKVKSEIAWTPEYSTWRRGFREALA